jgi:phosphonate degradation associated HDIG domain protein
MIDPTHHPALEAIQRLFDARGTLAYGESVNQIEHALQCGTLAEQEQAAPALVLAAWLHDIGHMQHRDAAAAVAEGTDDVHEILGAKLLSCWFEPSVCEPVRLHVQAKRYLCAHEPGYRERLSPLSQRSLEIQGGPMSDEEAQAFERLPFHADAVRLRRWDDAAKRPGSATLPHEHFMALAARCLRPG